MAEDVELRCGTSSFSTSSGLEAVRGLPIFNCVVGWKRLGLPIFYEVVGWKHLGLPIFYEVVGCKRIITSSKFKAATEEKTFMGS